MAIHFIHDIIIIYYIIIINGNMVILIFIPIFHACFAPYIELLLCTLVTYNKQLNFRKEEREWELD